MLFLLFVATIVAGVYWLKPCWIRHDWGKWQDDPHERYSMFYSQFRICKRCQLRGHPFRF